MRFSDLHLLPLGIKRFTPYYPAPKGTTCTIYAHPKVSANSKIKYAYPVIYTVTKLC